ncbi:MAG: Na/Pi cotransporter family protein [Erysipelotrichaceae bacterium]|nr:Na/Pi cotransporter family protein [Erysipelotrichaceae bacterium]
MSITDILSLFGGLALFLYGMRLMGDGLKEGSSGTLKKVMESVTNNPFKAFLLGLGVTALIQSSTATIVITSGLVAAGIITLRQSLGIIVGANVGTTVTGQIIRLLDLDSSAVGWLNLFKPSTLAPIALIIGIVLIMGLKVRNGRMIGNIAIGFGILFTGLINMTTAVDTLSESGAFEVLLNSLSGNPFMGYTVGAVVSFILQSSSATIGILQAFSASGHLTFKAVYAVIAGVFLGDCLTTAIVCWIGTETAAKRVGLINVLFNLCKTVLSLAAVLLLHRFGFLDGIWERTVDSGGIANTNTLYNLGSALVLLPFLGLFEKAGKHFLPEKPKTVNPYQEKLDALNPVFFDSPALALRSCYDLLLTMFTTARENVERSFALVRKYDPQVVKDIDRDEEYVDQMADRLSNYLAQLSGVVKADYHVAIMNQYFKDFVEFERLSDLAVDIAEEAEDISLDGNGLPEIILQELDVLHDLLEEVMDNTYEAFRSRDLDAAARIEPLEEVVDNMVISMKEHHLKHLADGKYTVYSGTAYVNILGFAERISDMCSNIGLATVARVKPIEDHEYEMNLLSGRNEEFNEQYAEARKKYFGKLHTLEDKE